MAIKKHGLSHTRLYTTWHDMKRRCDPDLKHPNSEMYCGKGITYCDEWGDFLVFRKWALSTGYADDKQINRIDPLGNYEPDNCEWLEYRAHVRADSKKYDFRGKKLTVRELSEMSGLSSSALYARLNKGWDVERALSVPLYRPTGIDHYSIIKDPVTGKCRIAEKEIPCAAHAEKRGVCQRHYVNLRKYDALDKFAKPVTVRKRDLA